MGDRRTVMEILRQEHVNMGLLLDILDRQAVALRRGGAVDFALLEGIIDYFLTYPDLVHHPKEDLLFHRLRMADPSAAARAEALLSNHEILGLLARRLARALVDHLLQDTDETRRWFVSLANDFVNTNRHHMAEEEKNFFPLVRTSLSENDWMAVNDRIGRDDDPLFGALVETRFKSLHRYLADSQNPAGLGS